MRKQTEYKEGLKSPPQSEPPVITAGETMSLCASMALMLHD
jgi:hypothetical protein